MVRSGAIIHEGEKKKAKNSRSGLAGQRVKSPVSCKDVVFQIAGEGGGGGGLKNQNNELKGQHWVVEN